ncbi:MAG TPA: radical SAM protein [Pyrinomonadaceae bacterium]|nr:radical SAM protein [Pyrinomonadaceae bacterium]
MTDQIPAAIYGPVRSWRLGSSLGVDLLCVDSICSFECVYCQLGKINRVTTEREIFVSTEKVLEDLQKSEWQKANVITFSGSGEPTLAKNLGEVIEKIKKLTRKPIVVLTNSTLLHDAQVRRELLKADKIFCKLDAWSNDVLRRVDKPSEGILLETIISGIFQLRQEFGGFLAIQTMILRPPNDLEIEKLAAILLLINADEVQLNLPTRPIPHEYFVETRGNAVESNSDYRQIKTISKDELEKIRQKLSQLTNLPVITRYK